jgi:dihydrofolate reductase
VSQLTRGRSGYADRSSLRALPDGQIIASFLDEGAIDEFIVSVVPIFIGQGIPLIAPRHRAVPLKLRSATPFPDGVVQVHYDVPTA